MKKKNRSTQLKPLNLKQRLWEGFFIANIAVALFLLLAFITHDPFLNSSTNIPANIGGRVGVAIAVSLFTLLGQCSYLFPLWLVCLGHSGWKRRFQVAESSYLFYWMQSLGCLLIILSSCALTTLFHDSSTHITGGLLGQAVASSLVDLFDRLGTQLFLFSLLLIGITVATGFSWLKLADKLGKASSSCLSKSLHYYQIIKRKLGQLFSKRTFPMQKAVRSPIFPSITSESKIEFAKSSLSKMKEIIQHMPSLKDHTEKTLPSLDLLDPPTLPNSATYSDQELTHLSQQVELKLKDFGVSVRVVAVHPGPVITRLEMQLAAGIKASRITSLAKDLARSLSMVSVRVVEIIPGKSVVGLELPNRHRQAVKLSEILNSPAYQQATSTLSLALGKDIAGHPVVVNLAKMPHLLVAGTTGSGKSVGLNAILLSFLYKATPEQVRLIMIDPKMLELAIYEGIPHLIAPVVTDMKEAANALRWCVAEMERRYKLMAALGVRNLVSYNNQYLMDSSELSSFRSSTPSDASSGPLPYIVVLIDEFADMMMVVGKKVEELIARIAQKARAAGIHLILATQRPSVDVITGLIKANIPTRISFQVSSKIDSRTILDQPGAEQLLGSGDMLYLAPGAGLPMRIHGAFVADHEVHKVVEALKSIAPPDYIPEITESTLDTDEDPLTDTTHNLSQEQDPLYDKAVRIVIETRRASISGIQRRLKIGYNRAARLIETMELAGIVSAMESNGSREILVPNQMDGN